MDKQVVDILLGLDPLCLVDVNTRRMLDSWQEEMAARFQSPRVLPHRSAQQAARQEAFLNALVVRVLIDLAKTALNHQAVYGGDDGDGQAQEPVSEGTPAETS